MTEIDDEMINRAAIQLGHGSPHNREDVRRALEAALNPKPEPEIEVSEGMLLAGWEAYRKTSTACKGTHKDSLTASYRAMESRRLSDAKKAVWVQTACVERGDGKFEVSGFYAQEGATDG